MSEIDVLRQRYRNHRQSLATLAGDAPSEALATEYQRLIGNIDSSLRKLDEVEGRPPVDPAETQKMKTSPGTRPLATPPPYEPSAPYVESPPRAASPASRLALIVVGGLVVLVIIGWLIMHASDRRGKKTVPVTETTSTAITPAAGTEPPVTPAPTTTVAVATGPATLKVTPILVDYGVVRKGTRQVRQVEVVNSGAAPVVIEVSRSACRCLFYEYDGKSSLVPKKKETITVVVDGGKAKAGALDEKIVVSAKNDPAVSATFNVRATVR